MIQFPSCAIVRYSQAALFGLAACLMLGSSASTAGERQVLTLTGSSTVAPLAAEIAKRYEEQHPGVRIDVQTGGSSRGVHDAREGLADIGMVSRTLYDNEHDLRAYTIAIDGITMIVNKSNPVTTLTRNQIVDIYTGRIRDWSGVSSGSGAIVVENKAEGRSTLDLFLEHFKVNASEIRADIVVGDNEQAVKVVAGNRLAIGYVSVGAAAFESDNGIPIKALPLDGVEPTVAAVASKRFPIIRELNLVVKQSPEGLAKDFIAFAQSEKVDDLINDLFYVPIH
jgi:phosphate transport system substrate-binding protein